MANRPPETLIERHFAPRLEVRAPATGGVVDDPQLIDRFRDQLFAQTGVRTPTVLLVNLEGRFLTVSALYQLVLELGKAVRAPEYAGMSVVFATPDQATRDGIRALAQTYQVPLFVAPAADRLGEAEAVGPLTAGEQETLGLMRRLGGRVTVAQFAEATGLDSPAAANRLNSVASKHYAFRVDRPKSSGHLYIAPWLAETEDAADPVQGDYEVPFEMRADVRALAALQGRAPDDVIAEALTMFIDQHSDDLKEEFEKVARMMREGDQEGLGDYTARFAKKRADARVRNRDTPKS
jgi:hypothetical protein